MVLDLDKKYKETFLGDLYTVKVNLSGDAVPKWIDF